MVSVTKQYAEKYPDAAPLLTNRDCAHCIDLVAKDSANAPAFSALLVDVNLLVDLLNNDRVNGIRKEINRTRGLEDWVVKTDKLADTRFNKAGIMLMSVRTQRALLKLLSSGHPSFKEYYESHDASRRNKIDATLNIPNHNFWLKVDLAIKWFNHIHYASKLVSSNSFPMSAYLPTVIALHNGLRDVLQGPTGMFDSIFGAGSVEHLSNEVLYKRFNMSGATIDSRRVGLLDPYQVWSFIVDPYKDELPRHVAIEPSLVQQVNGMLDFFLKNTDANVKKEIRKEFMEFFGRQGDWVHVFHDVSAHAKLSDIQIVIDQNKLTLNEVSEWVLKTGGHDSRLQFFTILSQNRIYDKIVEPLLSVRSTGSIVVERVAKPMKNDVLSKFRQRLGEERAEMCLRAGMNLGFLMNSRAEIRGQKIKKTDTTCE